MTIAALVVGGTSGIGYAIATRLAASLLSSSTSSTPSPSSSQPQSQQSQQQQQQPQKVLISGRTKPSDLSTRPSNLEFLPIEATCMRSIKEYTTSLLNLNSSSTSSPSKQINLSWLVLTQGTMTTSPRTPVPLEGLDRKMALHYYGKQLLIRELLPLLTPTAKVLIVYDGWLGSPDKLDWEDLDLRKEGSYTLVKAADHCTSMMDGMVQWWALQQKTRNMESGKEGKEGKEKEKRIFIHAYPGGVNTNLMREVLPGWLQGAVKTVGKVVLTSPEACAERLVRGTEACAETKEGSNKGWSNIDNKGKVLTKKAVWTQEQMDKVAGHTWGVIDQALLAAGAGAGAGGEGN